jgi:hypothetical protein
MGRAALHNKTRSDFHLGRGWGRCGGLSPKLSFTTQLLLTRFPEGQLNNFPRGLPALLHAWPPPRRDVQPADLPPLSTGAGTECRAVRFCEMPFRTIPIHFCVGPRIFVAPVSTVNEIHQRDKKSSDRCKMKARIERW